LAQALLLDSGRYSTPYAFVRALRQRTVKAALPMPTGAVRLLTVHGAKGLEADTVLLLDADPEKPGNEPCSLLIDWPVEAHAPILPAVLRRLPSWRPARVGRAGPSPSPPTSATEDARAAALGRAVHRTLEWAARSTVAASLDALAVAAAREFGADEGEVRRH